MIRIPEYVERRRSVGAGLAEAVPAAELEPAVR
jgi:hypothetical protein